jgi:hypothetical protein
MLHEKNLMASYEFCIVLQAHCHYLVGQSYKLLEDMHHSMVSLEPRLLSQSLQLTIVGNTTTLPHKRLRIITLVSDQLVAEFTGAKPIIYIINNMK